DRNITVEFDALQTEPITTSIAAVQGPDRKLGDIDLHLEVEGLCSLCRNCDAGGYVKTHGSTGRIIGITENRRDRVRSRAVVVILHLHLFQKRRRSRQRLIPK